MTKNEQELVEKIAHLARIKIKADDIQAYAKDMQEIIKFVEHINAVNTDNVNVMAHPLQEITQRLREDVVTEENKVEQLQSVAPEVEDNFFLVPNFMKDSD